MAGVDGQIARKSDLGARTLSAVVMVAVAGLALWLGGWWWNGFVVLIALGVLREWIVLARGFVRDAPARGLWNAAGILYVGFAAAMLAFLRGDPFGYGAVLTVVGAVVATDVGAYFAGRTIGGPKIAPRISPSKTWAGLGGGIVCAALVLVLGRGTNPAWQAVLGGVFVAAVAQAGDFFESWMKRRAGVKDSGRLLPGHGGLFDRLDGLLAVLAVGGAIFVLPEALKYL
ncbi:MAG TPA: phosphatidate cytidylyltransferase [Novosphingobium sp.]